MPIEIVTLKRTELIIKPAKVAKLPPQNLANFKTQLLEYKLADNEDYVCEVQEDNFQIKFTNPSTVIRALHAIPTSAFEMKKEQLEHFELQRDLFSVQITPKECSEYDMEIRNQTRENILKGLNLAFTQIHKEFTHSSKVVQQFDLEIRHARQLSFHEKLNWLLASLQNAIKTEKAKPAYPPGAWKSAMTMFSPFTDSTARKFSSLLEEKYTPIFEKYIIFCQKSEAELAVFYEQSIKPKCNLANVKTIRGPHIITPLLRHDLDPSLKDVELTNNTVGGSGPPKQQF